MKVVNIMSSKVLGGVEQVFLDYNEALNLKNHEVYAFYNKFGKIKIKLKTLKNVKYIPTLFIKQYFIFLPYLLLKIFHLNIFVHSIISVILAKHISYLSI